VDEMNQIKILLALILGILILQVILSPMILYGLNKQSSLNSINQNLGNANISDTTEIISQIIKKNTHVLGNQDSTVAITMFADFECPYCNEAFPVINKLINEYKDKVKFSFHHFPLTEHKNALQAALALEAAGKQNKYWDMYNLLIEGYKSQGAKALANEQILQYAEKIGLDMTVFQNDLNEQKGLNIIQEDLDNGKKLGIKGIPTVYISNQKLEGIQNYEDYSKVIEEELNK